MAAVFAGALARQQGDQALRARTPKSCGSRKRSARRTPSPQRRAGIDWHGHCRAQPAIRRVMDLVRQVAVTDATVLLLGETGTGKELFASCIHELSQRRERAMVRVNCAAIPSALVESELFGREKGAFTGALSRQIGRFESANHSTIFLDEISDLPLDVQVKLLRVLEERRSNGSAARSRSASTPGSWPPPTATWNGRIIDGRFREDLFYRLNVFPIQVPPLRDRAGRRAAAGRAFRGASRRPSASAWSHFPRQPGRAAAIPVARQRPRTAQLRRAGDDRARGRDAGHRVAAGQADRRENRKPANVRRRDLHVLSVLDATGWRVRGAGGAAEQLGLKPSTLEARMAKLGLRRPKVARPA